MEKINKPVKRELENCPFCNSNPEIFIIRNRYVHKVICECGVMTPSFSTKEQAISLWNTRAESKKDGNCPTCGSQCKVVGDVTMSYEPIEREKVSVNYIHSLLKQMYKPRYGITTKQVSQKIADKLNGGGDNGNE